MANANSENPYVGRKFQELVQSILEKEYSTSFEQEAVVAIVLPRHHVPGRRHGSANDHIPGLINALVTGVGAGEIA
jgi:hypothetical protein